MRLFPRLDWIRNRVRSALGRPETAWAHCDIPCGIYDPHEAQIGALTVLRMDQLIAELAPPAAGARADEIAAYTSKLARYTAVKEQHAERVKHEIRVIYGDYFTPDLLKQSPRIGDLAYEIFRQASKARQGTALGDAQKLLELVNEFAALFWKSKGVGTHTVPSHQKSGGDLVLPSA